MDQCRECRCTEERACAIVINGGLFKTCGWGFINPTEPSLRLCTACIEGWGAPKGYRRPVGVFRCAYHRCQLAFTARKQWPGELRFCSPEHGKRFHAAKRMKAKATGQPAGRPKKPTTND